MNLENQSNKVKEELLTLYKMMKAKAEQIDGIAPRHEVRKLEGQIFQVKTILRNYFDLDQTGGNSEIEIACKIADKY